MSNTLMFLITLPFDIYLFILFIRLILSLVRAEIGNPVTQNIVTITQPIVRPVKKTIPDIRTFETSTFVIILVLEIIKFFIKSLLSFGMPNLIGLLLMALTDTIKIALITFSSAILIQAIMSWLQPASPMNQLLVTFNAPVLRPFQRILPPFHGLDLSPIPALIVLQLLIIVVVKPLAAYSLGVAFG